MYGSLYIWIVSFAELCPAKLHTRKLTFMSGDKEVGEPPLDGDANIFMPNSYFVAIRLSLPLSRLCQFELPDHLVQRSG